MKELDGRTVSFIETKEEIPIEVAKWIEGIMKSNRFDVMGELRPLFGCKIKKHDVGRNRLTYTVHLWVDIFMYVYHFEYSERFGVDERSDMISAWSFMEFARMGAIGYIKDNYSYSEPRGRRRKRA